jgi:putative SOS response-associated peptidase YedK
MCYNTRISREKAELEYWYKVKALLGELEENDELVYNHANGWGHPNMWILPQEHKKNLVAAKWGLMPSKEVGAEFKAYFAKNRGAYGGLNSRADNLFTINLYRNSIIGKRCIVPVDGFFEPHTTPAKEKGKPVKVPFYFKKRDDSPINLAGIYSVTSDKMITFSVITKEATPLFAEIHNQPSNKYGDFRRPVVLDDNEAEYWLEDGHNADDIYDIIDNDLPDHEFNAWPVTRDLYKAKGLEADNIKQIDYKEIAIDYEGKPEQPDLFG